MHPRSFKGVNVLDLLRKPGVPAAMIGCMLSKDAHVWVPDFIVDKDDEQRPRQAQAPPQPPMPLPGQRPSALQLIQALIDSCSDPRPDHTAWLDDWIDDDTLRFESRSAAPTSMLACACMEMRRRAKTRHARRNLALSIMAAPDQRYSGPLLATRLRGVKLRLAPLLGLGYSYLEHTDNVRGISAGGMALSMAGVVCTV